MTALSWKERFARQASDKVACRVPSGLPAILNLRPDPAASRVDSIAAIEALVRRHLPLLQAKRAIEAVLADGLTSLQVPKLEDPERLAAELRAAGLLAQVAPLPDPGPPGRSG